MGRLIAVVILVALLVTEAQAGPGATITAWLMAGEGDAVRLGALNPDADGKAALTYTDQQRRNLIALCYRVVVTAEAQTGGTKPAGKELMRDEVPGPAMVHVRHLVARFEQMPQGTALALGMVGQAAVAPAQPAPAPAAGSTDRNGPPPALVIILGAVALLALLGVGAWFFARRRGAGGVT